MEPRLFERPECDDLFCQDGSEQDVRGPAVALERHCHRQRLVASILIKGGKARGIKIATEGISGLRTPITSSRTGVGSKIVYGNGKRPHLTFAGKTPDKVYATAELTKQLAA